MRSIARRCVDDVASTTNPPLLLPLGLPLLVLLLLMALVPCCAAQVLVPCGTQMQTLSSHTMYLVVNCSCSSSSNSNAIVSFVASPVASTLDNVTITATRSLITVTIGPTIQSISNLVIDVSNVMSSSRSDGKESGGGGGCEDGPSSTIASPPAVQHYTNTSILSITGSPTSSASNIVVSLSNLDLFTSGVSLIALTQVKQTTNLTVTASALRIQIINIPSLRPSQSGIILQVRMDVGTMDIVNCSVVETHVTVQMPSVAVLPPPVNDSQEISLMMFHVSHRYEGVLSKVTIFVYDVVLNVSYYMESGEAAFQKSSAALASADSSYGRTPPPQWVVKEQTTNEIDLIAFRGDNHHLSDASIVVLMSSCFVWASDAVHVVRVQGASQSRVLVVLRQVTLFCFLLGSTSDTIRRSYLFATSDKGPASNITLIVNAASMHSFACPGQCVFFASTECPVMTMYSGLVSVGLYGISDSNMSMTDTRLVAVQENGIFPSLLSQDGNPAPVQFVSVCLGLFLALGAVNDSTLLLWNGTGSATVQFSMTQKTYPLLGATSLVVAAAALMALGVTDSIITFDSVSWEVLGLRVYAAGHRTTDMFHSAPVWWDTTNITSLVAFTPLSIATGAMIAALNALPATFLALIQSALAVATSTNATVVTRLSLTVRNSYLSGFNGNSKPNSAPQQIALTCLSTQMFDTSLTLVNVTGNHASAVAAFSLSFAMGSHIVLQEITAASVFSNNGPVQWQQMSVNVSDSSWSPQDNDGILAFTSNASMRNSTVVLNHNYLSGLASVFSNQTTWLGAASDSVVMVSCNAWRSSSSTTSSSPGWIGLPWQRINVPLALLRYPPSTFQPVDGGGDNTPPIECMGLDFGTTPSPAPPSASMSAAGAMTAFGAAVALLASPTAASSLQGLVLFGLAACAPPALRASSTASQFLLSPFYALGAVWMVAGNMLLVIGVGAAQLSLAGVLIALKGKPILEATAAARFPQWTYAAWSLLQSGVLRGSLDILVFERETETRGHAVVAIIGVVYTVVAVMLLFRIYSVILPRDMRMVPYRMALIEALVPLTLLRPLVPVGRWGPEAARARLMRFISSMRAQDVRWMALLPIAVTTAINVIAAIPFPTTLCGMQWGLFIVVSAAAAVVVGVVRPHRSSVSSILLSLSYGCASLVAFFACLSVYNVLNDGGTTASVAGVGLVIISILRACHAVYMKWIESRLDTYSAKQQESESVGKHLPTRQQDKSQTGAEVDKKEPMIMRNPAAPRCVKITRDQEVGLKLLITMICDSTHTTTTDK